MRQRVEPNKRINVDYELVEQVRLGDKQAFDLLVIKYQFKILKLVNRYVNDPSEAMDVAQESFIKAYRALDKFRGDSAFYTWLYRIAINTAKNHVVSQSRRMIEADVETVDMEQTLTKANLKEYSAPEKLLLDDEIEHAVYEVIAHLPKELRTAITLRELEGMSYEEIAGIMACPVGTVRSRIFRAREAIERRIKPLLNET
ncbi:RNA polymerase sigma factor RpoE [Candidatus Berkiella aquae]|uniref:ECF RNA polymerase sigma-E factor n=1 Tax=Candidatus Berkiella aquae TaxID=295108 RepID=A0A0Q9YUV2_9GAMM|nr:RNA polymerase sigma factor RpoE [Candidatus Berkiella aquae]MCS5711076.1 RNA polymerase sigma factor RpoE [Candidatus Berkiella aquae]